MFTFENPSHRQRLTELGILLPNEAGIAPADLAHRIITSPHFEEALYILKQDFAHPLMTYGMVESQMEMAMAESLAINSLANLAEMTKTIQHFRQLPTQAQSLLADMRVFVEEVESGLRGVGIVPKPEVQRQLDNIDRFSQQLAEVVIKQQPILEEGLRKLRDNWQYQYQRLQAK